MEKKKCLVLFLFIVIFIFGNTANFSQSKPEILKLENGLLPPVLIKGQTPWTLTERMKFYKVPGVSIAMIRDFKIDWSKGYGVLDATAMTPVTETTLFQASSVSKPVTAMAVLKEYQDGKIRLDKDVNDMLVSWKLPENDFTAQQKVTVKNLLNHSAGTTVSGFWGYPASTPIPSLLQVLNGQSPANSEPVLVDMPVGKQFRYSSGGYCVLQQLLIDTEKQIFPDIMEKNVLQPLGMIHSTFSQPLTMDRQKNAACGHRPTGLRLQSQWHVYPEMAAAGLWTTAQDLANFVSEIQLSAKNKSNKVLNAETTKLLLTPYISPDAGLGIFLEQKGKALYFGHSGSNEGYRCFFIGHAEKGYGAVIMTNSDNGDALYAEIVRGIASVYQWDEYLPEIQNTLKISPKKLKQFVGKYSWDSDHVLHITFANNRLYAQVTFTEKAEIFPVQEMRFIRKDQPVTYIFIRDPETDSFSGAAEEAGIRTYLGLRGEEYTVPLEMLLAGEIENALAAYRKLRTQDPTDANLQPLRLLSLADKLFQSGSNKAAVGLLNLCAEFHPEFIKHMVNTLNNKLQLLLQEPGIPDASKKEIKDGCNAMLKKLGLKEIE